MTIESLERVMRRIREKYPNKDKISNNELQQVIMMECGTDIRTYNSNRRALIKLGWIKSYGRKRVILTNEDI